MPRSVYVFEGRGPFIRFFLYFSLLIKLTTNSFCRQTSQLSKESLEHLESVFRNHLGKGKEEFTIAEFKKIVPSKNVSE